MSGTEPNKSDKLENCPACGESHPSDDFDRNDGCPTCGASRDELFQVAAGHVEPDDVTTELIQP